jgi:clumping factor A
MRQKRLISSLIAISAGCAAGSAFGVPVLRTQVDQRGDFVLFGNTSGFECANNAGVPAPTLGTVDCPAGQGGAITDTAPDVFWRADDPAAGQATASDTWIAAQARTTAVLDLPTGATITHARIYWAGMLAMPMSTDTSILIERPGTTLSQTITADDEFYLNRGGGSWYQSTADIRDLLVANGEGAYRISDIGSIDLDSNAVNNDPMVGWVVVVFYSRPQDPPRNLALFDGLDLVPQGGMTQVTIDGFVVPNNAGFDAKLGVVAYEGEQQYVGDALTFNGGVLSNAANPANNFFNSTRSRLGTAVSTVGDLPQLTGGPASMAGIDMDVVDVKAQLQSGDTSATIVASSAAGGDTYTLGAFITSIATFKPDFATSGKAFVDLNGAPLLPNDIIEYTVTVTNTGNDASINTVMTDALPAGVTYVPGSISVDGGAARTDAAGDDVAEYTAGTRTLTVRLGTNAGAATGGSLAVNATTVVKFRVTIDGTASGSILNQAVVTAEGELGAPSDDYPTDGNGNGAGVPPTEVVVDRCGDDDDCAAPNPVCDTAPSPNVCVECLVAADCTNPTAPECLPNHTCGCVTNCDDTDSDGIPDDTEDSIGTDPADADTDDDGVIDGDEPNPGADSDGDGSIDALDPDSDNDGLYDGTEMGLPCNGPAIDPGSMHCIADGDAGATETDPLDADTDDGGVKDGSEDVDHDGVKDAGETDPTTDHGDDDDDLMDDDDDGLTNGEEDAIGSDPMDADSDDDGVIDGSEANPSDNNDDDGLINVLDPDSDDDGLYDGTELGLDCGEAATDPAAGHCVADGDPDTTTSPIDPDTDHGGVTDGNEDVDLDGVKDANETDPTLGHGDDDGTLDDDDDDGLSNGVEGTIGTNPNDADSDDDGVTDGDEPNFADDTDSDGDNNALDSDSDDDGLLDGTELGNDCAGPGTDAGAQMCVADGDAGATTTNPLDPDTDDGSVEDGAEDTNHDGVVDAGERDPNDPSDDGDDPVGIGGAGGGGAAGTAGQPGVGGDGVMAGAAGGLIGGNGGIGGAIAGGAGTPGSAGANAFADGVLEGGGCACRTTAPASSQAPWALLVSILGVLGARASRRRRSRG